MIKKIAKKYKIVLLLLFFEFMLSFLQLDLVRLALSHSFDFFLQVMNILPPVMILLSLLETWLPQSAIENHLGQQSGAKGMLFAVLLGSMAAGPLFTAFPVASSISSKGGRIANTVIFLGAWATIKVPMLLLESRFLGLKFSLLRLVITVPFIILIGLLIENISQKSSHD